MSPLRCMAKCMVINFLVILSVCVNSTSIYFENYLIIPFMRFLLQCLASRNFLILLGYFLLTSFISIYFIVSTFNIPRYYQFSLLKIIIFLIVVIIIIVSLRDYHTSSDWWSIITIILLFVSFSHY